MRGIIAVNNLGFIGLGDKLLWNNKEDLNHFKELTLNQTLLVGFNTYQGLPVLKNRKLIIHESKIKDEVFSVVEKLKSFYKLRIKDAATDRRNPKWIS